MTPQIYLFRHGETAWSLAGQHTGRTDIPLTAKGEADALVLGQRLVGIHFTRVFTSPRQRARRTCELAALPLVPEIDPDLAEWDYGDYEGQKRVDLLKQRPGWDIFNAGAPGGESPAEIADRADRVIARLRLSDGNSALFTHGHFGRVLAVRWLGLPIVEARHLLLDPASLSILGYEHNNRDEPVIARWNA